MPFLLIPTVLLVIFTYIPAAEMVIFSFEERDQFGVDVKYVGLQNYKTVFDTPEYFAAFNGKGRDEYDKIAADVNAAWAKSRDEILG